MSHLFDSSSLLLAIRRHRSRAYELLRNGYTLNLALYEVGNALWKETALLGTLTREEASSVLSTLHAVIGSLVRVIEPRSWARVLELAIQLGATYYDSAYVVAAHEHGLTLVTEDERLRRKLSERADEVRRLLGERVEVAGLEEIGVVQVD